MKINDARIEQRIFQKTREIIAKRGVKGWNMDQLAEDSGLAKNTLYKIIGSKENLLKSVLLDFITSIQTRLSEVISAEEGYLRAFMKMTELFPELLAVPFAEHMQEIFLEYPELEDCVRSHQDVMTDHIMRFIEKGIDTGVLALKLEPGHVFEMLQAIVLYYMKSSSTGSERSAKISQSFQYLINGLMRREERG